MKFRGQYTELSFGEIGILSPELPHIPALLVAAYEEADPIPDWLAFQLLTAMRRASAAQLAVEDLDFTRRVIRRPGSQQKNGEWLYLPMTDAVYRLLARRALGRTSGYVFPTPQLRNGYITSTDCSAQLRRWKRRVRELTGDSHVDATPHQLREYMLDHLQGDIDVPDSIARVIAGHASQGVTERHYMSRANVERLRESMQTYENHVLGLTDDSTVVPMWTQAK